MASPRTRTTRARRIITTEVTRITAARDGSGRPRLLVRTGPVSARITAAGSDHLEVSLLATVATLLGGDDVRLVVEVRDGLSLTLKDIAATVAYDGRGQGASWMAELNVGPGASLVWAAEPFIVSDGAEAMRILRATLADGAGLRLDETVVLGRHGERGGRVHSHTLVQTSEAPLLVEDVVYEGAGEDQRFVRGAARSISTRLAFGTQTLDPAPGELLLELACGGRLARRLPA